VAKTFFFARKPRREDPLAALTVQKNLEQLAEALDAYRNKIVRGTDTVITGNTSKTVTHNLGFTPYQVFLGPTETTGKEWWVANKTADTFDIVISSSRPAPSTFDWVVYGN